MLITKHFTDRYYCLRCKKDVISGIAAHIEDVNEAGVIIVEIGITVNCTECGGEIRNKYIKTEI